jgi:hypothetical protein
LTKTNTERHITYLIPVGALNLLENDGCARTSDEWCERRESDREDLVWWWEEGRWRETEGLDFMEVWERE